MSKIGKLLFVGGGRNAHNLIGIMEGAGIEIGDILDDRPSGPILGRPVRTIDSQDGRSADAFLTIADPVAARAVRQRPALSGCRWPSVIYPNCIGSSYAEIGEGSYVGPFTILTNTRLGRHVHLFAHNSVGARSEIGDFTVIMPGATVASDARIGAGCLIGTGARILAGVIVGDDCRVGANVVVRRDMPDGSIALSEPAVISPRRRASER